MHSKQEGLVKGRVLSTETESTQTQNNPLKYDAIDEFSTVATILQL